MSGLIFCGAGDRALSPTCERCLWDARRFYVCVLRASCSVLFQSCFVRACRHSFHERIYPAQYCICQTRPCISRLPSTCLPSVVFCAVLHTRGNDRLSELSLVESSRKVNEGVKKKKICDHLYIKKAIWMFPVLEESVPIVQIQRPPSRKLSQTNIRSQNHLLAIENIYKELTKTVLELANKQYEKCILINCLLYGLWSIMHLRIANFEC